MFYVVYGNIPATDIAKDMEDSIGDVRDEEEERDWKQHQGDLWTEE